MLEILINFPWILQRLNSSLLVQNSEGLAREDNCIDCNGLRVSNYSAMSGFDGIVSSQASRSGEKGRRCRVRMSIQTCTVIA